MPPLTSVAVSMAVMSLAEAVEGDAHEPHQDFPASEQGRRLSLSSPTAAPHPCIKSLSQGGDIPFRPGCFDMTGGRLSLATDARFHAN